MECSKIFNCYLHVSLFVLVIFYDPCKKQVMLMINLQGVCTVIVLLETSAVNIAYMYSY